MPFRSEAAEAPHGDAPAARFFALIPCAGSGSRAVRRDTLDPVEPPLPKQYQTVAGQPMVMHTLAAFAGVARISDVLVVVAPGDDFFEHHSATCAVSDCGGPSRAASVRNGLHDLFEHGARGHDWVLVHDAARCLVTPALIDALIDACRDDEVGGLLAHRLADTLKQEGPATAGHRVAATLDRDGKWLAQTPQMFRIGLLSQALDAALTRDTAPVTDEAGAIEAMGLAPRLVAGSALNFKVTYPDDFMLADAVLRSRQAALPAEAAWAGGVR